MTTEPRLDPDDPLGWPTSSSAHEFALELDDAEVLRAANAYLGDAVHELDGLELVAAESPDGRTATATLRAVWNAPIDTEFIPVEVPIEVTATARSVFH